MSPEVKLTVSSGLMFCTGIGYAAGPSVGTKVLNEIETTRTQLESRATKLQSLKGLENSLTLQIGHWTGMLPNTAPLYTTCNLTALRGCSPKTPGMGGGEVCEKCINLGANVLYVSNGRQM